MFQSKDILQLKDIAKDIKAKQAALYADVLKLSKSLKDERMISENMNDCVTERLGYIRHRKNDFDEICQTIGLSGIPERLGEAVHFLEKLGGRLIRWEQAEQTYCCFVKVFSTEATSGSALEQLKTKLTGLRRDAQEKGESSEYELMCSQVQLILNAMEEKSQKNRFRDSVRLSQVFDLDISYGVAYSFFYLKDQGESGQESSDEETAETEVTAEEKSPEGYEEKVLEETEETEEDFGSSEEKMETPVTWETLGIADPSEVAVEEDSSLMEVFYSPKKRKRFGVNEFEKELAVIPGLKKAQILRDAYNWDGITKQTALEEKHSEFFGADRFEINDLMERLYRNGYLEYYQTDFPEALYTLTARGRRAFENRDTSRIIKTLAGELEKADQVYNEHNWDGMINPVRLRICMAQCRCILYALDEGYKYESLYTCLEKNYSVRVAAGLYDKLNVAVASIVSDDPRDFAAWKKEIQNVQKMEVNLFIIIGMDKEKALNTAKWASDFIDVNVYAAFAGSNEMFDLDSGQTVSSEQLKERMSVNNLDVTIVQTDDKKENLSDDDNEKNDKENGKDSSEKTELKQPSEEPDEPSSVSSDETVQDKVDDSETVETTERKEEKVSSDSEDHDLSPILETVHKMLCNGYPQAASAYMRAACGKFPELNEYRVRLAYALDDPEENCVYSSDYLMSVFADSNVPGEDWLMTAALIRNYFYDQSMFDSMIRQLYSMTSENRILNENAHLHDVLYQLYSFKKEYHYGIDRYADYHRKNCADVENAFADITSKAEKCFERCFSGTKAEVLNNKRFIETKKIMFSKGGNLGRYLSAVIHNDRTVQDELEAYLKETFIRHGEKVSLEEIDDRKIDDLITVCWEEAADHVSFSRKTSDLVSGLRNNLYQAVKEVVSVLVQYDTYLKNSKTDGKDPAETAYRNVRSSLLEQLLAGMEEIRALHTEEIGEQAGQSVLLRTLEEMTARLEGTYKEQERKYYYIDFLKNDRVLLDEDYFPDLSDVQELEELSAMKRIEEYCRMPKLDWDGRLREIFAGQDDYGSAELILHYLRDMEEDAAVEYTDEDLEQAVSYPLNDMDIRKQEFTEDLELAGILGQIDHSDKHRKEFILSVVEEWYSWTQETHNFGFFYRILQGFRQKIQQEGLSRLQDLENDLDDFLACGDADPEDEEVSRAASYIRSCMKKQNYAAAEDMLNRLIAGDYADEDKTDMPDYLREFLQEYDMNYGRTADTAMDFRMLGRMFGRSEEADGAAGLIDNWPRVGEAKTEGIRSLLEAMDFHIREIQPEKAGTQNVTSYSVLLKTAETRKRTDRSHPIAAFGSLGEEEGFRVICLFSRMDTERLIDTCLDLGNDRNTLVLLDYALTMAERRKLARKSKEKLTEKVFAVVDRVVILYLASHYKKQEIQRMLMSVTIPFAYCQPYLEDLSDPMIPEIFIGRRQELQTIEEPNGKNMIYGGHQLGKSSLLEMARLDIDGDKNNDRAVIVNVRGLDVCETAAKISEKLYQAGVLKTEKITENWKELSWDILVRLQDTQDRIPFLLLMLDEGDAFLESCAQVGFDPFQQLKNVYAAGENRFKFVVAGLHDANRLQDSQTGGYFPYFDSLEIMPFNAFQARQLMKMSLHYLGFRFEEDEDTQMLMSAILGMTNYLPGLIQLYGRKLVETMQDEYAGYSESATPPYEVSREHMKKVLVQPGLQEEIRARFMDALDAAGDNVCYVLALLAANYYADCEQKEAGAQDLQRLAIELDIRRIADLSVEEITVLLEEMCRQNILKKSAGGRYRFARYNFCQLFGTLKEIDDELTKYIVE